MHDDVCETAVLDSALGVWSKDVVGELGLGVLDDDVPRMEEARELSAVSNGKACRRPIDRVRLTYPSMQRRMLMMESAEQMPRLTHTERS